MTFSEIFLFCTCNVQCLRFKRSLIGSEVKDTMTLSITVTVAGRVFASKII